MVGRIIGWVVSSVLLLAVIGYVFLGVYWGDRLPGGTTAFGVDIGHKTAAEAKVALQTAVKKLETTPISVTFDGKTEPVVPSAAGLKINVDAMVARQVGIELSPQGMWRKYQGGRELATVTDIDAAKVPAVVAALSQKITTGPVNGNLAIVEGALKQTPPQEGTGFTAAQVAGALHTKWLTGPKLTTPTVALPVLPIAPAITQEVMDSFIQRELNPSWVKPVALKVNDKTFELTSAQLQAATVITANEKGFTFAYDGPKLLENLTAAALKAGVQNFGKPAVNATLDIVDAKVVASGGTPGLGVDAKQVADVTLTAAKQAQRTGTLKIEVVQPAVTVANVNSLGIKELVSEFSTKITSDEDRTHNLVTVAGVIDQQLVLPGATFSMNKVAGPYNRAQGYRAAGIISGGVFSSGVGGGVSQMGTTLYNAMFFAGLEDVEHRAHSLYITRYPVGREATINYNTLDVKFKNDTNTAILMKSFVADGKLTVQFWGTKHWDITTTTSDRFNFREPRSVTSSVKGCVPSSSGTSGFSVTVVRNWHKIGDPAIVRSEKETTTYDPTDKVKCTD